MLAFRDIIIANEKQRISGDILIDDAPQNLIGGNYAKFLFTATHNRDFNIAPYEDMYRVNDWREVYDVIDAFHAVEFGKWIECDNEYTQ